MKQAINSHDAGSNFEINISPNNVLDINYGFVRSRILNTSLELRIFTLIYTGINNSNDIALTTSCKEKGIIRLLNALLGMGLLVKKSNEFELTEVSRQYLVEGKSYLGEHLQQIISQWDKWSNLTNIIKEGGSIALTEEFSQGVKADLFPLVFPRAQNIANKVDLPENAMVLDIEPGSGEWGIAFASKDPTICVTAVGGYESDRINKRINSVNLGQQYKYINIAWEDVSLDEKYDLIVVSHSFRFMSEERSKEWLNKIKDNLKYRGKLLLIDALINDEGTGPHIGFLLDLSMLVNTKDGSVRQKKEYISWLSVTGFKSIEIIDGGLYPIILAGR